MLLRKKDVDLLASELLERTLETQQEIYIAQMERNLKMIIPPTKSTESIIDTAIFYVRGEEKKTSRQGKPCKKQIYICFLHDSNAYSYPSNAPPIIAIY